MQKENFIFIAIFVIAVVFSACTEKPENILVEKTKMNALSKEEILIAEEYNADFEQVALAVSQLIATNSEFKQILKKEVAEKFDGDYNVLISQLVTNYSSMESWFGDKNIEIRGIVEKYPLIQIAIPINFEKWNIENLPVFYLPYDFNEVETELVNGFNGNEFITLNPNEKPDFPVAVISNNERTEVLARGPSRIISAPTNLTAIAGPDGITLNWEKPTEGVINSYYIYRSDDTNPTNYKKIRTIFGEDILSYFDKDTDTEIMYTYYIVGVHTILKHRYVIESDPFILYRFPIPRVSSPSNTASAVIYRDYPANTLFISNAVKNKLTLNWGHLTYNPQNVEVWRRAQADSHYTLFSTLNGNIVTFQDENLPANNLYHYKVRALAPDGDYSEWSNSIATYSTSQNYGDTVSFYGGFERGEGSRFENVLQGDPEIALKVYDEQGNEVFSESMHKLVGCSGEIENWNGKVLIFFWYEEDFWLLGKYQHVPINTYYEDRYEQTNNLIKQGITKDVKIGKNDDMIGFLPCYWWDVPDYPYAAHIYAINGFQWDISKKKSPTDHRR
ncbi:MAG: hypothetical protein LBN95_12495 [Prevotellaceae bacterium]|jgi:hypothetical protein|nr:hypothetical protein [Prevotellaceae bacterium]